MPLPPAPSCVITGAASGLGRALAVALARRGAHLVLGDVDVAALDETAQLAMAAGAADVRAVRCDVTRLDEVEGLAHGERPVDLVVNNAGVASAGRIGELPIPDWRWTLDVDLMGVVHGCHVFVPRLRRQGHGHLLNVASAAGIIAPPRMAAYNVAKAGVIALSETLAGELLGTRVRVTVLCPTFVRTNIARSGRFTSHEDRARGERLVAGGKSPESVAQAALAAVERDELYCLPMADARWLWRMKRAAPRAFPFVVGKVAGRRS